MCLTIQCCFIIIIKPATASLSSTLLPFYWLQSPGAGRRVGETCEQLWAQAKSLTSQTRYMATPNYLDCWDDFMGYTAYTRLKGFVSFMVEQHRTVVRKLGKCTMYYTSMVTTLEHRQA